jgi:hypothetical protein
MRAIPRGNIIEFGAYKGGNAIFMAHVASRLLPGVQILSVPRHDTTDPLLCAYASVPLVVSLL